MNNQFFVNTKEFGSLYIDEVFVYYDMPLIFSVINILGYRYICIFESEDNKSETYLLVPVSFSRYQCFVSNRIPIRELYENPEMGKVLAVTINASGVNSFYLSNEELKNRNLPPENEYLDIKESYTNNELLRASFEKRCGIVQVSFEKNGSHKQSIKAKELSIIISKLQKVMDGIKKDWKENCSPNASKEQIQKMSQAAELNITKTFAASFGIEFESEESRDLLNESAFDYLMQQFLDINEHSNSITQEYYKSHKQSVSAIRDYYKALMVNRFAVKLQVALPNHRLGKTYNSINDITKKYNYLTSVIEGKTEQIEIKGQIVAFDIKSKTFKFQPEDGTLISGKIDDDFSETIFDTANTIIVLVNKKTEILTTGDELNKYELLSIVSE